MESNNNNETSFLKKMLDFFKKNPVLGSSIATIILYVVGILILILVVGVIFYQVIALFSSLFGIKENDLVSGKYSEMSLTELQENDFGNCYQATSSNGFTAFWNELFQTNATCELVDLINGTIEKYEKDYSDYNLKLSPGLVISTLVYSYSSQPHEEGEKVVNSAYPMQVLEAIAKEKIITEKDVDSIINNMIFYDTYYYYNCTEISCDKYGKSVDEDTDDEDIRSGKQCSKSLYFDVRFSREKYEIFLRYGEEAAAYYETAQNHNKSLPYICDGCYVEWRNEDYYKVTLDTEKYSNSVNIESDEANNNSNIIITDEEAQILNADINDINSSNKLSNKYKPNITINSGKTFTYEDGFIYNKFPSYKEAFESGTFVKDEIFTFKTIEKNIKFIETHESTLNDVYGVGEVSSDPKGHAKNNLEVLTGKKECPSEQSCDCTNGNLRPSGGTLNIAQTTNSEMCSYLEDPSAVKIRLYSCTGSYVNKDLPGGYYNGTINGKSTQIANNAITLEQYIKGATLTEISISGVPIEAIKFQMLMVQSNLFHEIESGDVSTNSSGELTVKNGSCFQNYNDSKYRNVMSNTRYSTVVEEVYAEIKNKLLINADGTVTNADWGSQLTDEVKAAANSGLSYPDILNWEPLKKFTKFQNYSTATPQACNGLGAGDPVVIGELIDNARQYVGMNRTQFQSATGVNTEGSWCARFVSHILKITPNASVQHSSSSVSNFMSFFVNNNRFCHSQYWYNQSGKYGCTDAPQEGDIVMFAKEVCGYTGNGHMPSKTGSCWRHIGIVSKVRDNEITYIHGNTSICSKANGVCESTMNINDKTIIGYGR